MSSAHIVKSIRAVFFREIVTDFYNDIEGGNVVPFLLHKYIHRDLQVGD